MALYTPYRDKQQRDGDNNCMKNGFESRKCKFAGKDGYMVNQYINGFKVSSQFVKKENYGAFCKLIGCKPMECSDSSQFVSII